MYKLNWAALSEGGFAELSRVILKNVVTDGVYIIWHGGNPGRVVYVGQGDVASRLCIHRNRADINACSKYGTLYVTWASVPAHLKDGIERYLADKWNPLIGEAHPDVAPIVVNSPW